MTSRTTPGTVSGATKVSRPPAVGKKEHPILFSGPLVRAILEGRKTQTRRLMKETPTLIHEGKPYRSQRYASEPYIIGGPFGRTPHTPIRCPYGAPGDALWLREAHAPSYFDDGRPAYRADWTGESADLVKEPRWTPSIHMPRALSRIDLEVTAVRLERLCDITGEDAIAEGIVPDAFAYLADEALRRTYAHHDACSKFAALWEQINAKKAPWASSPWVWVVSFQRVRP